MEKIDEELKALEQDGYNTQNLISRLERVKLGERDLHL